MVIGKTIDGAYFYAKDGLLGKWQKWILLIISCIIFPLFMGYMMRIYRGVNPAPELDEWGSMFIDGIKLCIVQIIFALPVIFLDFVLLGSASVAFVSTLKTSATGLYIDPNAMIGLLLGIFFGSLIIVIVAVLIGLFTATAFVRFARTGSFSEAFNFSEVFSHIGKIGWMTYIVALLMLVIMVGIVTIVSLVIPYIGFFVFLILLPFLGLFTARYLSLLYDLAGTPA
ncbi:MAG: DUF4013 domain-containing protein [Methanoregula sp.]|nr:DUF4013 domain-containing protein [Methanoregula sp.]